MTRKTQSRSPIDKCVIRVKYTINLAPPLSFHRINDRLVEAIKRHLPIENFGWLAVTKKKILGILGVVWWGTRSMMSGLFRSPQS